MMAHTRHGKAKGVILVGRREGTVRVLNEEMADLVRSSLARVRTYVLTDRTAPTASAGLDQAPTSLDVVVFARPRRDLAEHALCAV